MFKSKYNCTLQTKIDIKQSNRGLFKHHGHTDVTIAITF